MKKYLLVLSAFFSVFNMVAQVNELKSAADVSEDLFSKRPAIRKVDPIPFVNPFIGTGGHGHTFPGPVLPFGMVQVGPDTRPEGWDGCGGYHYSDSIIYGFSHTHLSGVGVPDYADVLLVPQQGNLKTSPAYRTKNGFGATFKHANEKATPGFYSVSLNNGINVRLTATKRCALHEYTFTSDNEKKFVLIDLSYRDQVIASGVKAIGKNHVQGFRRSKAWATDQHVYFDLTTNIPFSKSKIVLNKKKGTYYMILEFPKECKQVMVAVSLSGTTEEGAALNKKAELTSWDFDAVAKNAANEWRNELSKVQAFTKDKTVTTNFYTALYHSFVHPSLWSDVTGKYRTFGHEIAASKQDNYSVFSLWDTYRGANPLYTILQPKRTQDFIESFRLQFQQTGLLPMWTLSNNETNCMIGYHSASIIADAHAKGIPLENKEELLTAMIASSNYNHLGKVQYAKNGFIDANLEAESVSKTLEYAYDDWCISKFAKQIGNDSVAKIYELRSANWMNLYHPESGFFQARKGGMWLPNFKPNEVNHHYTEANAWQYSLGAPHHISQLIALKGKQGMERFLDSLFYSSSVMSGREQSDITGLIGQYAHGNEPSHHIAYCYNYCGAPYKSQELVDKILRSYYTNEPDGLSGNEDCGQMSAWYVLSAMGFYPVAPGSPTYTFGRPLFEKVSLQVGEAPFIIETSSNSPKNKYIQAVTWNGMPYNKLFITHDMIVKGGKLFFEMGEVPQFNLGNNDVDLQDFVANEFVPVPYFVTTNTTFSNELTVGIDQLPSETGTIYYSFDSINFIPFNPLNDKPLILNKSCKLFAKVQKEVNGKLVESKVIANDFVKFEQNKSMLSLSDYANQYAGSGLQTLVDGQKGTDEYRSTEWQGFQGKDVTAVIVLNDAKEISQVTVSSLEDMHSWIFGPASVTIEVSNDGVSFKHFGTKKYNIPSSDTGITIKNCRIEHAPIAAKFIRVTVRSIGNCPDWHLGTGNPTWLFLDEIQID